MNKPAQNEAHLGPQDILESQIPKWLALASCDLINLFI